MSKAYDKTKESFQNLSLEDKQKIFPELSDILSKEIDERNDALEKQISELKEFKQSIKKQ